MIPMGLATLVRNCRFRKRSVRQRDGYQQTMSFSNLNSTTPFDFTGVECIDVLVNNPGQLLVASTSEGDLLHENPVGSGVMQSVVPPIPLPAGISMQTAKAYNRIYMAFSDLLNAMAPPMVMDGPTQLVSPVSQNPIGAIWTPGRNYLAGDVVRTSQNPNRWFRCIIPGQASTREPDWPTLDGYFAPAPGSFPPTSIISIGAQSSVVHGRLDFIWVATVVSTTGFTVGSVVNLTGVISGGGAPANFFNTNWTISGIGTNTISLGPASLATSGYTGSDGLAVQAGTAANQQIPAIANDFAGPVTTANIVSIDVETSGFGTSSIISIAAVATTINGFPVYLYVATVDSVVGIGVGEQVTIADVTSGGSAPVGFFNGVWTIIAISGTAVTIGNRALPQSTYSGTGGTMTVQGAVIAYQAVATVDLNAGFAVGSRVTVSGVTSGGSAPGNYWNTDWQISNINGLQITLGVLSVAQQNYTGVGGTMGGAQGLSQWVEWTPACPQFLPPPESPEMIISVKGQPAAPAGTISAAQDVYVCFAYQNANGESAWTPPIVFTNTAADDVLEVFFQLQNEVPGPVVPVGYGTAGYGGPRMPNWLMSVIGLPDPTVAWPSNSCLNVYVAAVGTGTDAPQGYYRYQSGIPVNAPLVVSAIPVSGTVYVQRVIPTAALTTIPYIGESGARYLAVGRQDQNESLVPIDPGSPLLVNFQSSVVQGGTAQIDFIQRSSHVVTCTVDQLAGFIQGAQVVIAGVTDTSFNGSFILTGVAPNQYGGATLIWSQPDTGTITYSDGSSFNGTASSGNAAYNFITPQSLIATIARATNVVTATINSLQGLSIGAAISVAGVTDTSFNSGAIPFTILTIVANNGGGGTLTWNQTATDATSTGGYLSPTGVGTGNNSAQSVGFIVRNEYPASSGTVLAIVFDPSGKAVAPPPGFGPGGMIVVAGMSDSSFDGTFIINNSFGNPGTGGGFAVGFTQAGANAKINGPGGTLTLLSGTPFQQSRGNITAIARASQDVTATLDTVANFSVGQQVNVTNVADSSFDGSFIVTSVNTGTNQLQWTQPGVDAASAGGIATATAGGTQQPTPVAILPPGGPFISQDIAAFSVQDGDQAGPFTYIPEQDPVTPFTTEIISIGAVDGAVTALLSSTSGLVAGDTVQVSDSTDHLFDGVFVLAQVSGNTAEWAGNGPGTGYAGGTLTLIPLQPTIGLGQNAGTVILTMSRSATGLVSAQVSDISNLTPGMRMVVYPTPPSGDNFDGQFNILSVSQNQLPGSTTPLSGTVTWQSSVLNEADHLSGGYMVGIPGIVFNADDNTLSNALDITNQLSTIGAPSCVDGYFSESLNMMVYTIGQDSSHYFSNPGDPANIQTPGGILGINESNGERTVCFREMISGELLSLKEKSGYEVTVGSSTPNEWGVSRRWGASDTSDGHGPAGVRAVAVADDFLIYFDADSGPYRYHQGVSVQVGQEKQGTWDRINKDAANQICVAIDNVLKEVHFGLPLDGAIVPNHDLVLNYFNGWNEPLMLTLSGDLMPDPHGRRWSDNDGADSAGSFRLIKVLKRTLLNPPNPQIEKRQIVFCLSGIATGNPAESFINMSVPDQRDDNGAAIDQQYQLAFAQSPTVENFLWDKWKGRVLGAGMLSLQPVTEDPAADLKEVYINLDTKPGLPLPATKAMGGPVGALFTILFSNQNNGVPQPGWWFELHRSVRYGKLKDSGTGR